MDDAEAMAAGMVVVVIVLQHLHTVYRHDGGSGSRQREVLQETARPPAGTNRQGGSSLSPNDSNVPIISVSKPNYLEDNTARFRMLANNESEHPVPGEAKSSRKRRITQNKFKEKSETKASKHHYVILSIRPVRGGYDHVKTFRWGHRL